MCVCGVEGRRRRSGARGPVRHGCGRLAFRPDRSSAGVKRARAPSAAAPRPLPAAQPSSMFLFMRHSAAPRASGQCANGD